MVFPSCSSHRRTSACSPKVIIFDWDDTICPSSFVDRCNIEQFSDMPSQFQKLFDEIAICAEKCLHEASKHGEVIIITNSDDGWVKYSCERYVPKLIPVIEKYRIVSARTRYERFYPRQPLCWKAAAFAHEVNELFEACGSVLEEGYDDVENVSSTSSNRSLESTDVSSDSGSEASAIEKPAPRKEVISFGDSMEERTAVRIVADQLSSTPKSVMFISSPTPTQLIGQLHMLTNHMAFVCDHASNLDLEISPDQAEECAHAYLKRHKVATSSCGGPLVEEMARMLMEQAAIDHDPIDAEEDFVGAI